MSVNPSIVQKWLDGVLAFDEGRLSEAAGLFKELGDFSAKMWYNSAMVHLLQGNLTAADQALRQCVLRDEFLSVAHFHRALMAARQGRLEEGRGLFVETLRSLRSSNAIDYRQLGLDLCLSVQQVQHNLKTVDSYLTANRPTAKISEDEMVTLPIMVFRPAKVLVDNIEKRQFLKQAQVISAVPTCVLKKPTDGVKRPQSSSAPTSPTPHRRRAKGGNSAAANFTPPPSRPPPRLPPSVANGNSNNCHGNSAERPRPAPARPPPPKFKS